MGGPSDPRRRAGAIIGPDPTASYLRKQTSMRILSEFERRLEGAIEGIFSKAFGGGVQPVELARRILKEMDGNRTVGVREVWVPNRFVFHLSPEDRERFGKTERSMRRELEQVVREGAADRGWRLVGPAEVLFETDDELGEGRFRCEASLVEAPSGERVAPVPRPQSGGGDAPPAPPEAAEPPAVKEPPPSFVQGPAQLVMISGGADGRTYELDQPVTSIGRLPASDILLSDPGASRRHAEIRLADGRYVIVDLGSTNGTMVNEASVAERELRDGDRITIGRTVLEFRRR
jgi:hypothetical protein